MHLTICIWTLERLVCSHRNIRILTFKTFGFDNALRLTIQFRKIKKNPKSHHVYLVGMQRDSVTPHIEGGGTEDHVKTTTREAHNAETSPKQAFERNENA